MLCFSANIGVLGTHCGSMTALPLPNGRLRAVNFWSPEGKDLRVAP